ncbi:MAG: agmatine deiminase family protein [Myxococcota bacterium]
MSPALERYVPPEWAPHRACWMAYPHLEDEWPDLMGAQREFDALVTAIAETENVELLCQRPPSSLWNTLYVNHHALPYGDVWTRDTAPVFGVGHGRLQAHVFDFNGWGGKFAMAGDQDVAGAVVRVSGAERVAHPFVLEGGALEFDGDGTLLTTRCVGLANRNGKALSDAEVKARLSAAFAVDTVLVLEGQLAADHTDGHVDTLARFVAPGEVVCMRAGPGDPNGAVLLAVEEQLRSFVDAKGRPLRVHTIPSPGAVAPRGELVAASYLNYYLANDQIIVPQYGAHHDQEAASNLAALYPARRIRPLSARSLIEGGGAFHCMTQQEPAL